MKANPIREQVEEFSHGGQCPTYIHMPYAYYMKSSYFWIQPCWSTSSASVASWGSILPRAFWRCARPSGERLGREVDPGNSPKFAPTFWAKDLIRAEMLQNWANSSMPCWLWWSLFCFERLFLWRSSTHDSSPRSWPCLSKISAMVDQKHVKQSDMHKTCITMLHSAQVFKRCWVFLNGQGERFAGLVLWLSAWRHFWARESVVFVCFCLLCWVKQFQGFSAWMLSHCLLYCSMFSCLLLGAQSISSVAVQSCLCNMWPSTDVRPDGTSITSFTKSLVYILLLAGARQLWFVYVRQTRGKAFWYLLGCWVNKKSPEKLQWV